MATKIIDSHDLSTGGVLSAAITDVGTMVLHVKVSGATVTKEVKVAILAKEGDGDYVPIREKEEINFRVYGNKNHREEFVSINSESVKIQVIPESGANGNIDAWYTKDTNQLS